MEITNEMIVTVYRFPRDEFLYSAHSSFETLIEGNPLVAYSTEHRLLFQSVEAYRYSTDKFVKDMMKLDGTEMSYGMYVEMYKNELNRKHADAPVLNDVYADQHLTHNVPEEFRKVNPFEKLTKLGINFKIG